jgi:hypothetical protein
MVFFKSLLIIVQSFVQLVVKQNCAKQLKQDSSIKAGFIISDGVKD